MVRDPARAITWAPGRTIIYHSTGGEAGCGGGGGALQHEDVRIRQNINSSVTMRRRAEWTLTGLRDMSRVTCNV